MITKKEDIKRRTKAIGLQILNLVNNLSVNYTGHILSKQLLRCATSIGANYRAACRAKSKADFVYKLKIVIEEADETLYWLELIEASDIIPVTCEISSIRKETDEIISILITSLKTMNSLN